MRSIYIPDSVNIIGYDAFSGHSGLAFHIIYDYDDSNATPGDIVYIYYQGTKTEWNALGYKKEPGQTVYYNVSTPESITVPKDVPIHRMYNRKTKEHLWTSSRNEYNTLPQYGWTQEGTAWTAPGKGTGVYRLYNPKTKDHHYTTGKNEAKVLTTKYGWRYDNNGKPVFSSGGIREVGRLYNKHLKVGSHHFTKSKKEYETLPYTTDYVWREEGLAFYCVE